MSRKWPLQEVFMTDEVQEPGGRRRMLAGLTAFAAIIAAKFTNPSRVEAAANATLIAGSTADYGVLASPSAASAPILPTITGTSHGVIGSNSSVATATISSGVLGARNGSNIAGVLGVNPNGFGVVGSAENGVGVRGEIPFTSASNSIAMYGLNNSTYAGPGPGAGGFGVYGLSARGHGLVGATASAGAAAVVGATNGVAGAYAAAFYGPVVVGGDFLVVGAKSAVVPHPDGTHRQLYCVESPESWFEDFGTARLVDGKAEVAIEEGFATVSDMANYHVFLTGYDQDHLLHVAKRTPTGFTVEANAALATLQGREKCDITGEFSWRVVAKRKDIPGERLTKVVVPPAPVLPPTSQVTQSFEGPREKRRAAR
jgi:hypothetical protein